MRGGGREGGDMRDEREGGDMRGEMRGREEGVGHSHLHVVVLLTVYNFCPRRAGKFPLVPTAFRENFKVQSVSLPCGVLVLIWICSHGNRSAGTQEIQVSYILQSVC